MADPAFSIILPTYRHGRLLLNAFRSICEQSRQDFEVFLVCDGANEEGLTVAREQARQDPRFLLREHPKGPGHGEPYRDAAIREASAPIICYHGDDDFWLEHHLEVMERGLQRSDMVYTTRFRGAPGGYFRMGPGKRAGLTAGEQRLDQPSFRARCKESPNLCRVAQFSATAHWRDSYLRLREGWTPRPPDVTSYANLWVKFVADPTQTIKPVDQVTSIVLPTNVWRGDLTGKQQAEFRHDQTRAWMKFLRSSFMQAALDHACTNPDAIAPVEVDTPFMSKAYKRKRQSTVLRFDGHLAQVARAYYESDPSLSRRIGLVSALRRLRSIRIEDDQPGS